MLATIIVGERPAWRQMLATATILVGIGSVFGAGGAFQPLWAAAMVFLTPLFWQSSHVMGLRMMPPLNPLTITAGRMIYGALALVALLLIARPHNAIESARTSRLLRHAPFPPRALVLCQDIAVVVGVVIAQSCITAQRKPTSSRATPTPAICGDLL